jgi:sulfatase modifying factor 1
MTFDPLVPRPVDLPTPISGELANAKIVAAPDDPADWQAWRDALIRWREDTRRGYDGSAYERLEWTQGCFAVALVWLWDERLYDHGAESFTPDRLLDEGESEFGGYDAVVLWHAYPVIGIDERNQFDWYREVPGLRGLIAALQGRGVKVFLDYNPWDVGTRREAVRDAQAVAALVRELSADGVFLDTMKEAMPELRAALPDVAFEGESTLPTERIGDHHLSWAQWFADSPVPGVIRARWFEQRHMLHHTRRWNRSHAGELRSAWLNGVGMLVWENVFGAWVGWNERDKALLRGMLEVQRRDVRLLTHGEWTPLAFRSDDLAVVGSRWSDGRDELWALANLRDAPFAGDVGGLWLELPALGLAAVRTRPATVPGRVPNREVIGFGGGDATYPAREALRVEAPVVRAPTVPDGFAAVEPRSVLARFRRRETGCYGDVPYIDEWKPLPPRLHDFVHIDRPAPRGPFAIAVDEEPVTGLSLREARAYAAERGARLPTEDEWQVAAEAGILRRREPLVWNWTESEHSDGSTRFSILKGGSSFRAEGSEWYVDGGPQPPEFSLKYLLPGPLQRSDQIGFRLAVDL